MNINYKTINGKNYMLLPCAESGRHIETQIKIITNTDVPQLLETTVTSKNGEDSMQYSISGLGSLEKYLERDKMSAAQFFTVVGGMIAAMDVCSDYGLSADGIVLDNRLIYIEPDTLRPRFAYSPTAREGEADGRLRDFVRSSIVNGWVTVDSGTNRLLDIVNRPDFTRGAITELLKGQSAPAAAARPTAAPAPIPEAQPAPKMEPPAPPPAPPVQGNRAARVPAAPAPVPSSYGAVPRMATPAKPTPAKAATSGGKKYPVKNIVLSALLVTVSIAIAVAGLTTSATRTPEGNLDITKAIGIVILLGALNAMQLRKWLAKEKMIENPDAPVKQEAKKQKPAKAAPAVKAPQPKPAAPPSVPAPPVMPAAPVAPPVPVVPPQPVAPAPMPVYAPVQAAPASDATELLGADAMSGGLCLVFDDGRTIPLVKSPFRVGREASAVDFVLTDSTVGRFHAEFVQTGTDWAIADNNSRNHTYVNEECLDPHTPRMLAEGDVIRLAKTRMTVRRA